MSRPQVTRPGAPGRPGAATTTTAPKGPSAEELRNLPTASDEGVDATFDPDQAASGKMVDEDTVIADAKFITQKWQKKDGTYATRQDGSACWPEIQLEISYKRTGDEDGDKPYKESYRYGSPAYFVPSVNGNTVKVRAGVVKEGGYAPAPKKFDAAMLFLQSLKNAKGEHILAKMKTDGAKALIGLHVHVRSQKVAGQNERAPAVLLVDVIHGAAPASKTPAGNTAPAQPAAPVAPATVAAVSVNSEIDTLATAALLDILGAAENNTIARAQIPTTLIRLDKWKAHEHRGNILKTLRDDAFITHADRADKLWMIDGANITKL